MQIAADAAALGGARMLSQHAGFVLKDWDKQRETMKGTFGRTMLPSERTDNSVPDFGARDVRFQQ
jgi:hypothetical protein